MHVGEKMMPSQVMLHFKEKKNASMEITSEGNAESQTTQFWLRARAAPPWCKSELALFLSQLLYLKHLEAMITHLSHKADQEMVAKPTNWGSFLGSYWKEQALRNKEQRWHTKRKGRLETLWAAHSCKTWPFRVGHVKGKRNTAPSSKIIAKFYINFKLFSLCVKLFRIQGLHHWQSAHTRWSLMIMM